MSMPEPALDLEHLSQRYRNALIAFFLRRTASYADAEDLTQEVFTRIIARGGLEGLQNAQTFMFEIASNLLRDRHRRHQVREGFRIAIQATDNERVDVIDPERELFGKLEIERMIVALAEVGERSRQIFILFRFEKISQKDIAKQFSISVSAVEKHVASVLAHLVARLER